MKKIVAAILSIAAIVLPQSAIAQYATAHKYTDAFGKTKIYILGTANSQAEYTSIAFKNITAIYDRCGWAKISMGSTGNPTSIESAFFSFLPIQKGLNSPDTVCFTTSASEWLTREPNSSGVWTVNISPNTVGLAPAGYSYFYNFNLFVKLIYGLNNPGSLPIKIVYNRSFKLNINSCGFGAITVTTARPMTNFKFSGVDYTLVNLPVVTKPMICRTQGNSKIRYVPLN